MTTTRTTINRHVPNARWLWALLVLLGGLFSPADAQTRDVITFTGGHADENNPRVYIIDAGNYNEDNPYIVVTLSRPMGATADREASITLNSEGHYDNVGKTITFAPGETTKTIELSTSGLYVEPSWSGNFPVVYGVLRTNHADAAYQVLVLNVNHTATEEPETCRATSSQELLMEYLQENPYNYKQVYSFHYGNYVLLELHLNTAFRVTADSRMVLKTRYTDHTGLATNADDYGMSKTREVVLTPINVGAVTNTVWYLYKPKADEMLYSYVYNGEYTQINNTQSGADAAKDVVYFVSELGPLDVAQPAADGLQQIFFSRADVGETFAYDVQVQAKNFYPTFSNVSIDKTSYKSGETMVITATMDNWHLMKRARQSEFISAFGVTFDDGQTTEPYRFDFDEATGLVTYYVTAPTVSQTTNVQVDFGPKAEVGEYDEYSDFVYKVITGSEGMFSVTVSPTAVTPVPATSIAFVDMPADGSEIHLLRDDWGAVESKYIPLGITTVPANATDAGTVTYSVTNANGANTSIDTSEGAPVLFTDENTGSFTLTATLASGVSTSRTYQLTTAPAQPVHHTNTYLAGTAFPKFQFEFNLLAQLGYDWTWSDVAIVNDDVTVNYTHANGSTWTEHYQFSQLNYYGNTYLYSNALVDQSHVSRLYDLPFVFTTEHPDASPEQIGQTLVSAEVLLNVRNQQGNTRQIVCTATLEPRLKDLSFKGYSRLEEHYHMKSDPTITSDVMYLPQQGFIVGYEIPELGLSGTYNDLTDGANVPDWLELQEDGLYTTAVIKVHPNLDRMQTYDLTMYTLAQRTCNPDEAMERSLTCNVTFSPISADENIVYRVNGEKVTGDLTFDNGTAVANFLNRLKTDGFVSDAEADVESMFDQTKAYFTVYDNIFEGAEVTLTREGDDEPLQTLTNYKGCFMFMPPADGRTYIIDVYYPAFDKHYKSTFVSHQMTGAKKVNLFMDGYYNGSNDYVFTFSNSENEYNIPFSQWLEGYIYADGADAFFLSKENSEFKPRIQFPEEFHALIYNNTPELKTVKELYSSWEAESGYADDNYAKQLLNHYGTVVGKWNRWLRLHWNNMIRNTTLVTLIDTRGWPVKNATLNYACVDKDMSNPTSMGSATYSEELGGYNIATDPGKYVEIIEVVRPGYQHPVLNRMNLWSYNYLSVANVRSHTIVLSALDNVMTEANLETLSLTDGYSRYKEYITAKTSTASLNRTTLLMDYSETADYPTILKLLWDERFGDTKTRGFLKYAHVTMNIHSDDIQGIDDIKLRLHGFREVPGGSREFEELLSPDEDYTKFIDKSVVTSFSSNHCLLDFDITEKIPVGAYAYLNLQKGETNMQWGSLTGLENKSLDMLELERETQFNQGIEGYDLTQVDDDIEEHGGDVKDTNKMFNSFNFSTPPTLPFTMNIERQDDYFIVRGIYEQNLIPNSQLMDLMDAAAYAEWFNEQFRECMNAVNNTPDVTEDRIRELKKAPSAFLGIKGYISGVGRLNGKGQLEVNFNDGGIIMEGSGSIMGKVSFGGIANFGARLSAGVAARMGLQNANMAEGNVAAKPLIDIISEAQFWLNVGAWMEIGVNLWDFAEAKCGIVGTAGIDIRAGNVVPTYNDDAYSGSMVKFDFDLTAYMKARFLCFEVGQNFTLLKGEKTFYKPEDTTNPYYPGCSHPMMALSRQNITKSYQKLSRKTRRALEGTSLFDNVSGMAQPTYLLGGESLLFNNLKTASNYNDDRLQVYSNGSKSDLVDTGVEAPMYGFAEAHNENGLEMVAFEQLNNAIDGEVIESYDITGQQKIVSEMSEVYATWRNAGGSWQTQKIGSMEGAACIRPAVAVSKENLYKAHAAVVWQQGKAMFNDEGNRYIEGSLMLSRFNGTEWSEPMEIMRINRRCVPVDYKMSIKTLSPDGGGIDEVLVAMTLKQDINNPLEPTKLVYLNVSPEGDDYKVRTRYTNVEANMLQMERVLDTNSTVSFGSGESYITDGANLVAYMEYTDNGRDLKLTAVDMKGEPTGKLNGNVGMVGHMVNDYRLIVDDNARDLSDVALLWNQSDEERTDNGDGTQTVTYKNRIYASKLCSNDKQIFFSSPIAVADIESTTEQMTLASMDGYLDGLDMKVAYSASNESDAAAVREVEVTFENAIDHIVSFDPYEVNDLQQVPVTITVENKGYEPIDRIDVTMDGETTSYDVDIMPMGKTDLKVLYSVDDDFDGTISYDVAANFVIANSNALKSRRLAATRPHRIQQSGTQLNVRQVDMALKVLSVNTDDDGQTTVVAEVSNASLLPLASDMQVTVGLYTSPLVDENSVSIGQEVTLNAADLYDATAKENKVKIVTLTAQQPDFDQTFYLNTSATLNDATLSDVRPLNNVRPVTLPGKYLLGDANGDGKVTIADVTAVISRIKGVTPSSFVEKAANVDRDEEITIADAVSIVNMILGK